MRISAILIPAILAILATTVQADIIYDNGGPDRVNAFASDVGSSDYTILEDFQLLAGNNVITGIQWWGGGRIQNIPDDFTISIYSTGGIFTYTPLATYDVGAVTRVQDGTFGGYLEIPLFTYSAEIAPLTLTPGATYYLEITNDTNGGWSWGTAAQSGYAVQRTSAGPGLVALQYEFAFNFTYDNQAPVPEPATLSLLGMGIVGLIARRKNRAV